MLITSAPRRVASTIEAITLDSVSSRLLLDDQVAVEAGADDADADVPRRAGQPGDVSAVTDLVGGRRAGAGVRVDLVRRGDLALELGVGGVDPGVDHGDVDPLAALQRPRLREVLLERPPLDRRPRGSAGRGLRRGERGVVGHVAARRGRDGRGRGRLAQREAALERRRRDGRVVAQPLQEAGRGHAGRRAHGDHVDLRDGGAALTRAAASEERLGSRGVGKAPAGGGRAQGDEQAPREQGLRGSCGCGAGGCGAAGSGAAGCGGGWGPAGCGGGWGDHGRSGSNGPLGLSRDPAARGGRQAGGKAGDQNGQDQPRRDAGARSARADTS